MRLDLAAKGAKIFQKVAPFVLDKSPAILAGMAGVGVVSSVAFAIKNTVDAVRKVDETDVSFKEDPKEFVKTVIPCYIPTCVSLVATEGFIFGGLSVSMRRIAALTSLAQLDEEKIKELTDFHNTVESDKPEDERKEIRIAEPMVSPYFPGANSYPKAMIRDKYTGQEFSANVEEIKNAAIILNQRMYSGEEYICFNEWAAEIGMEQSDAGDRIAFTPDMPIVPIFKEMELQDHWPFMPMIVMEYQHDPSVGFSRY